MATPAVWGRYARCSTVRVSAQPPPDAAVQVYARLNGSVPLGQIAAVTRRVERLGFDGIHVSETVHDPFTVATLAIEHSHALVVRTAVALAFVRSPLLTAYTAWDLSALSGGRFELGLGSQIRQNIEDRYGMPWNDPVGRMAEYVRVIENAFASFATGRLVAFVGTYYALSRLQPHFNPGPDAQTRRPPIWLGGVNARMLELAGETAHGWLAHSTNSHPRYLREFALGAIRRGAQRAGRPSDRFPIVAGFPFIVARDGVALRSERERQRRTFAFLYSTPAYKVTLELSGFAGLDEQLRSLIRAGDWDRLPSVVSDDVLDEITPSVTYDGLPDLVRTRLAGLVDGFTLPLPLDPAEDTEFEATLNAIRTI